LVDKLAQLDDLINIQNETFQHQVLEFNPKKLIKSILKDTKGRIEFQPFVELTKMPSVLLGDSNRVKYIVSCLLKNAADRNKYQGLTEYVKVEAYVAN
jgi:hypothetical protein